LKADTMERDASLFGRSMSAEYRPAGFQEDERNGPILSKLASSWIELPRTDKVPIGEALKALSAESGIQIQPDWDALLLAGIDQETTLVSCGAVAGRLERGLAHLLAGAQAAASDASPSRAPSFEVQDGVVVVADQYTLSQLGLLTVVYDIRDLLIVEDVPGGPADTEAYRSPDDLIQLLYDFGGGKWREFGDGLDLIRAFDSFLIVSAVPSTHRQVSTFFAQLREARRRAHSLR
jgi:hypothetical protein